MYVHYSDIKDCYEHCSRKGSKEPRKFSLYVRTYQMRHYASGRHFSLAPHTFRARVSLLNIPNFPLITDEINEKIIIEKSSLLLIFFVNGFQSKIRSPMSVFVAHALLWRTPRFSVHKHSYEIICFL